MKDRYFQILVDNYYESFLVGHIADIVTESSGPYDEFICELLNISDDEFEIMMDEAYELAQNRYFDYIAKDMKRCGYVIKD